MTFQPDVHIFEWVNLDAKIDNVEALLVFWTWNTAIWPYSLGFAKD